MQGSRVRMRLTAVCLFFGHCVGDRWIPQILWIDFLFLAPAHNSKENLRSPVGLTIDEIPPSRPGVGPGGLIHRVSLSWIGKE